MTEIEGKKTALNAKIHTRKKFYYFIASFFVVVAVYLCSLVNFFLCGRTCYFSAVFFLLLFLTTTKNTTNCIHIGWEQSSHAIILFGKVLAVETSSKHTHTRSFRVKTRGKKSSTFIKQVWIWCVKWMWEIDSCQVQLMPLKVFLWTDPASQKKYTHTQLSHVD